MPDFNQAVTYIRDRLNRELPVNLYYHCGAHTEDVAQAVERLAALENIKEDKRLLLLTAAWYHDCGYLEQYADHEAVGTRIMTELLPSFGYSPEQIHQVGELILVTRLPQRPTNLLEQIMCDADLDSLGREDFLLWSHRLRLEFMTHGQYVPLRAWYTRQLAFQTAHSYFTAAARTLRQAQKEKMIAELKELLAPPADQASFSAAAIS